MHQKNLSINAVVMSFMFACLVFGFLAIGVASASTLEQKTGTWVKKDYKITGQWSIEQRGDQQVILFNEQFKTKKGPDLKLFLSPQSIDEVTGRTATNNAVFIAELKSSHGSQEYVLPAGIDVRNFRSLVIHCEQFSVLWGGTSL